MCACHAKIITVVLNISNIISIVIAVIAISTKKIFLICNIVTISVITMWTFLGTVTRCA